MKEKFKKRTGWKNKTEHESDLSKYFGKNKVKVFKKFLHLTLCDLKRKRTLNWNKVFKYGSTYITQTAPESINMYDKGIFLAILKLFQDKEKEKIKNKIIKINGEDMNLENKNIVERKGVPDDIKKGVSDVVVELYCFSTISIKFNDFCKNYAKVSREGKNNVINSLKRWLLTKTIYEEKDKNGKVVSVQPFHYLIDFRLKDGVLLFTLSDQVLNSCKNGLIISYDMFLFLKSEIAKALYMFFMGNRSTSFSYETLRNSLGLEDEDFKNRELIKQGLNILKKQEFLKDFHVEKRDNDIFYLITYGYKKTVNDGDKTVNDGEDTYEIV